MRNMMIWWFIIILMLFSGCASVNTDQKTNTDPNILSKEPYSRVKYIANPGSDYNTIDVIQVTTQGYHANINLLLYKEALEKSKTGPVYIGNIKVSSYTEFEPSQVPYQDCHSDQVPYQDCHSEPKTRLVPYWSCSGTYPNQICGNSLRTETYFEYVCETKYRFENVCETKYRTEMRDVLYRKATADLLQLKGEQTK